MEPKKAITTNTKSHTQREKKYKNDSCPHKMRKHYAKGMCSTCYNDKYKSQAIFMCEHTERTYYAKGLCYNCYDRKRKNKKN